uniref:Cystin-1 n=1 Tax=Calidris pygmaea TaxID=425635 RepID=A0A8C3KDC9_9CHAR
MRDQAPSSLLPSLPAGRELAWPGCWSENTGFPHNKACTGTREGCGLSSILCGLWAAMASEQSPRGDCRSPPPTSPAPGSCWPLAPCQGFPSPSSFKPSGQSTISYDYSEEELMASIEREYCR